MTNAKIAFIFIGMAKNKKPPQKLLRTCFGYMTKTYSEGYYTSIKHHIGQHFPQLVPVRNMMSDKDTLPKGTGAAVAQVTISIFKSTYTLLLFDPTMHLDFK